MNWHNRKSFLRWIKMVYTCIFCENDNGKKFQLQSAPVREENQLIILTTQNFGSPARKPVSVNFNFFANDFSPPLSHLSAHTIFSFTIKKHTLIQLQVNFQPDLVYSLFSSFPGFWSNSQIWQTNSWLDEWGTRQNDVKQNHPTSGCEC